MSKKAIIGLIFKFGGLVVGGILTSVGGIMLKPEEANISKLLVDALNTTMGNKA